jgi:hypothetical protein
MNAQDASRLMERQGVSVKAFAAAARGTAHTARHSRASAALEVGAYLGLVTLGVVQGFRQIFGIDAAVMVASASALQGLGLDGGGHVHKHRLGKRRQATGVAQDGGCVVACGEEGGRSAAPARWDTASHYTCCKRTRVTVTSADVE